MSTKFITIEAEDWSVIEGLDYDANIGCKSNFETTGQYNLGIYLDSDNHYRTKGFVGICVLKDINGLEYVNSDGSRILLIIKPRFNVDQWAMLDKVMRDDEYDCYVAGGEKLLFGVSYDSSQIDTYIEDEGSNLLLAISYIRNCYKVCAKTLKRDIVIKTENLHSKLKGKIDFPRHLHNNVMRGREDYIYCKHNVFSQDVILNKGIRAALNKAYSILNQNGMLSRGELKNIRLMYSYCNNALRNINHQRFNVKDFNRIKLNGFDSVYRPIIEAAKKILKDSPMRESKAGESKIPVSPYYINMEKLFELYTRTVIKELIKLNNLSNTIRLTQYVGDPKYGLTTSDNEDCYLMKHYITDLAFQKYDVEDGKWKYNCVLDAKYQYSNNAVDPATRRHNTHQLMFYMLMMNVDKGGFIFPSTNEDEPMMSCNLELQLSVLDLVPKKYAQFYMGTAANVSSTARDILGFVLE